VDSGLPRSGYSSQPREPRVRTVDGPFVVALLCADPYGWGRDLDGRRAGGKAPDSDAARPFAPALPGVLAILGALPRGGPGAERG